MRYLWSPSDSSYSLLEHAVSVLKGLGVLVILLAIVAGVIVAADTTSGADDVSRFAAAIGVVIAGGIYGFLIMIGGALLDVYLGIAANVSEIADTEGD